MQDSKSTSAAVCPSEVASPTLGVEKGVGRIAEPWHPLALHDVGPARTRCPDLMRIAGCVLRSRLDTRSQSSRTIQPRPLNLTQMLHPKPEEVLGHANRPMSSVPQHAGSFPQWLGSSDSAMSTKICCLHSPPIPGLSTLRYFGLCTTPHPTTLEWSVLHQCAATPAVLGLGDV